MIKPMLAVGMLSLVLTGCMTTTTGEKPRKTDPNAARDSYIQLGIGYLQEGETERAKAPLSEALKLDPRSSAAHTALALVFQQEGEDTSAEQHFRAALAAEPDSARILNNYGAFLLAQERYNEALQQFEKASRDTLYRERSRVFENLGLTHSRMDNTEAAKASFERALRLNSRQPLALLELAKIEFQQQHYVPAWEYYRRFTQLSGQTASSLWLGVQLARRFEDHNRAASYALQLRRLYPASPEARALKASESS
ncbi:type IV pilus biogenesis/stability protein PilW [Halopseudomonas nanhaiensis]|uniref:type IV pilus biogenesis/stability protein PilW n=1 Tax=Halopseudomonas nanhaiensis TaxID=2830842 RepID=UPI001CBD2E17|nr:type IV pilus biogenesis/stability protein PilW [Halopseudomonas nanhaiensis]UAW98966.1 type IV pilus biogenesis/stability protein PilW [Halopseudomonas nanhaiensis]